MDFKSLINRLNIINPNKWTQNFISKHSKYIYSKIVTLPKGTLIYRDDSRSYDISGEAQIPLTHYHNVRIFDKQNTYILIQDVQIFKTWLDNIDEVRKENYKIQPHYILYKLTNSTDIEDWLNKNLILTKLKNLNCGRYYGTICE